MKNGFWFLATLFVISLSFAWYVRLSEDNALSPPAAQKITTEHGLTVRIDYSRPSKRGRLIFGTPQDSALQPFGTYWRLGANEATVFEFSKSVEIERVNLEAGSYSVYAFPGPDSFEIGINQTWDRWGLVEPDYSKDLVRFKVPVEKLDIPVEQFTISLGEGEQDVKIICEWDNVRFVIPVREVELKF